MKSSANTITTEQFSQLQFQFPFRKYQRMILDQSQESIHKDHKFHVVAPPGSGKTIVGLEMIIRMKQPAVVFAPTSTIQLQWKEKVKLFIPPQLKLKLSDLVSTDPEKIKPINIYTYQLISSPAESLAFVEEAALTMWKEQMQQKDIVSSDEAALQRIKTLKKNHPEEYSKELRKFYKKLKDQHLRDDAFDRTQFLHANAKKLVTKLVSQGVKVIILDESHHLLDYWALVLEELVRQIEQPIVIGLTATPPLSSDDEELANYVSLVGEIDFEIPTPAVVKEGNLAPYQDLVYFCTPTAAEKNFIDGIQDNFIQLVRSVVEEEKFRNWLTQTVLERPLSDGKKQEWSAYFNSHVFFSIAAIKFLLQVMHVRLPWDIVVIEEMESEMTIDDWVMLFNEYALNFLKLSEDSADHQELKRIQAVLKVLGFSLTESGLRKMRAPADTILALSESKRDAVVDILRTEMKSIGKDIRAVVITDFENESATVSRYLRDVLDQDAGSAVGTFRKIVADSFTTKLEPVLVTGSRLLIDVHELPTILKAMNAWKKESGLTFTFKSVKTEYPDIVEISGAGKDWKSNTYVRMMTQLFEEGVVRCLVGTRGILGEGWDSLTLNTLIDLTQATTSMTVNQIRGRSIRLDPNKPMKVANNWDVVCVAPHYEKGNQDFERFMKKHAQYYGLGDGNMIMKGIFHVDSDLAFQYSQIGFKRIGYHLVNQRMLNKSRQRAKIHERWKVGEKYQNFEYSATKLDAKDLKFRTVYQMKDNLKKVFHNILIGIVTFIAYYLYFFGQLFEYASQTPEGIFLMSTVFVIGTAIVSAYNIRKYIILAFYELPLDSFVQDIGKAMLKSLRETGHVSSSQSVDNVRVIQDAQGHYDLYIDYATAKDALTFSECIKEVLSPVTNQRYLVSRSEDDIDLGFYSPIWWILRKVFRLVKQEKVAYHPVPQILSVNKKFAKIFGQNWREYVGGGDLIYTRSAEGVQILLELRQYNRHKIRKVMFEIWK